MLIRKWLSVPRILNSSAPYHKRSSFPLKLASIFEIYKLEDVGTVMMLRESKEMETRRNPLDMKTARKWKAEVETVDILSPLTHRDRVSVQVRRKGLRFGGSERH